MLVLLIPGKIISIILFWYGSTGGNNVGAAIHRGHVAFPTVSSQPADTLWYVSPVDSVVLRITRLKVTVLK